MTDALLHPQPIGAFGLPAGFLLMAGTDESTTAARQSLVSGKFPQPWPATLAAHREVLEGDLSADDAARLFPGDDPVSRYNRWVLDPASDDAASVRAALPASAAALVDVVGYSIGLCDAPSDDAALAPEVRALVLATRATLALTENDPAQAPALLLQGATEAGSESPALAAVLEGNAGTLLQELGDLDAAADHLTRAADALADSDLTDIRAELLYRLGSIAQERAASGSGDARTLLHEAMKHYYDGLQLVTEHDSSHLWASLNMNLATAHLAVPMTQASDQLRLGVATASLRAARRVFSEIGERGQWATATLNLANALVYTPSTHQGDNLVEAVELYEEVLESGVREHDPLGRARLLANQGNVLAHLGAFEVARPKLVEARYLFEAGMDHDGATTVRGLLDEIAKTQVSDPDDELTQLARSAEQMSRMAQSDAVFTSGMGVSQVGIDAMPPPKPVVTVVDPASRPAEAARSGGEG